MRELFGYLELAAALLAGALWYLFPGIGLRPLFLVLAVWAVGLAGNRTGVWSYRFRTPLDLPLALFVATAAVGLWATYNRDSATAYQPFDNAVGWQKFGLILAAVLICYALAHLPAPRALWLAIAGIALAGALAGLYFLLSHDFTEGEAKIALLQGLGLRLQTMRPALSLHQFGSNQVGSVTAMAFPLALQLILGAWGLRRRTAGPVWAVALVGAVIILALDGLGLLMTVSRGAWLALAAALFAWAGWAAAGRSAAIWNARHPGSAVGPAEFLVVPLALGLLALLLARPLVVSFMEGFLGPGINRLELMRLSTLLVRDYPFTGVGLGTYPVVFSLYTLLIHVPFIGSPHNLYIELAAEQGVAGLLAWLAVVIGTLVLAWRTYRRGAAGLPLGGAVAMLLVLLLHGLVDDPLYARRIALLFFLVPMGLIVATWRLSGIGDQPAPAATGKPPSATLVSSSAFAPFALRDLRRLRVFVFLTIALIVAVSLFAYRTPLAAAWHANLGALAQTRAELAVYDPERFGDPTIDGARRQVDTSAAEAHFHAALALVPGQVTASQRLAMLARARGDYAGSLAVIEPVALTIAPDRVTRLLYADALIASGQVAAGAASADGLPFARSRLLGQAWEYGVLLNDAQRAAWANEAAALVTDDSAPPVPELGSP